MKNAAKYFFLKKIQKPVGTSDENYFCALSLLFSFYVNAAILVKGVVKKRNLGDLEMGGGVKCIEWSVHIWRKQISAEKPLALANEVGLT